MRPTRALVAFLLVAAVAGCGGDDDDVGDPAIHETIRAQTDCTTVSLLVASNGMKARRGDKAAAAYRETALKTYEDRECDVNGRKPYERIEDLIEADLRSE